MILHLLLWLPFGEQRRIITTIEYGLVAGMAASLAIVGVGLVALAQTL